jgi:type IV pilus assembly protein PilB
MVEVRKRVGEMLLEAGIINDLQQTAALGEQKRWGGKFGSILISMGFATEESVASVLEKQYKQKCISLKDRQIPSSVLSMVKPEVARRYGIIPLEFNKRTLTIATSEPNNLALLDDLSFMLGVNIKPQLAVEYEIKQAIDRYYG